jgi:hypothetical protein
MSTYDPAKAKQDFPSLAFLVDDPEIGNLIRSYYEGNHDLDGTEGIKWFQRQVYETQWWRTRSSSARDALALQYTDPGEYSRRYDLSRAHVYQLASSLGVELSPDDLNWYSTRALAENLSDFEIRFMFTQGHWSTNGNSPIAQQVRAAWNDWLVPFNQRSYEDAVGNVVNQQWTMDNVNANLASQAKALYPHLAQQIDSGQNMRQITDPYRSAIANTLELAPDSINFSDPRWRNAIDFIDPQGNHRLMTISETQRFAMQQPEYAATMGARDKGFAAADAIKAELGKTA